MGMDGMTSLVTYVLLISWPDGATYRVAENLSIQECAGRAAMERLADERWRVRCEPQQNVFRVVKRK
jgi:hypothetical protein